jgi:putative FmdB family regulatory protein
VPTYGYRCTECGREFDVLQRMSDEPGAACPVCKAESRRLFFPAGIVFKGSGFYKTDSRSSSSTGSTPSSPAPAAAPSNGAPAKESSSTGTTTTAAKPTTTSTAPAGGD